MDIDNNLRVLQKYYAGLIRTVGYEDYRAGAAVQHMHTVAAQAVLSEDDGVDTKAVMALVRQLKEMGFSDLFLNGRKHIGIMYGPVPLEIEIMFTADEQGRVSSMRLNLYLRYQRHLEASQGDDRLCGEWLWTTTGLVNTVSVGVSKIIWGVRK